MALHLVAGTSKVLAVGVAAAFVLSTATVVSIIDWSMPTAAEIAGTIIGNTPEAVTKLKKSIAEATDGKPGAPFPQPDPNRGEPLAPGAEPPAPVPPA